MSRVHSCGDGESQKGHTEVLGSKRPGYKHRRGGDQKPGLRRSNLREGALSLEHLLWSQEAHFVGGKFMIA